MNLYAKIRGRPVRHLAGRGLQRARAEAERWGLPVGTGLPDEKELGPGRAPDATAWRADFRSGAWRAPFASLVEPDETARLARERWPEASTEIVGRSEEILEGRFDLLGYRELSFGRPVDWHLDPVAERQAPRVHWTRVPYLDPEAVGDSKVVWELNRHQWLVALGLAHRITGREEPAAAFARHLEAWMDANPPGVGINWASSLEVALRSVSWTWALHLFRDSRHLRPAFFLRALRYLTAHARYVEAYLSTYHSPNTHLTGEALGLVYLGASMPRLPGAEGWLRTGLEVLVSELDRQVLTDGVYFEHATWYHRYVAEFYLHLLILSRRHGLGVEEEVEGPLERILDHLTWLTRPDGSIPRVGDDDGGRLLSLDPRSPDDVRPTLAAGAALYGREDWAHVAGEATFETLWLLGPEGVDTYENLAARPPRHTARGFPQGGFYVARDGWTPTSNHLLIRSGSPGELAGHAHADALSFDLTVDGVPLLVDPGTGSYADRELRDRLRGTAVHNTLTLGDTPSAIPGETPFTWRERPRCQTEIWHATERFSFFRGRHDGFRRRGVGGDHVRSILSLKGDYWIVRDRVEGKTDHPPTVHLQFAPGTSLRREKGKLEARQQGDNREAHLRVVPSGPQSIEIGEGIVSSLYGDVRVAPVARFVATSDQDQEIVSFLVPGNRRIRVTEGNRRLWRIHNRNEGVRDLLLSSAQRGTVGADELVSDFEWTWARWKSGTTDPVLQEIVLVSGTFLRRGGRDMVRAEETLPWLAIRLGENGAVRIEAPAEPPFQLHLPEADPLLVDGSPVATKDHVRVKPQERDP